MKKKFLIPNILVKLLITGIGVFAILKVSSKYNLKIYILMLSLIVVTEIIFQIVNYKAHENK